MVLFPGEAAAARSPVAQTFQSGCKSVLSHYSHFGLITKWGTGSQCETPTLPLTLTQQFSIFSTFKGFCCLDPQPRIRIFEDGCLGVPVPAEGWQNMPLLNMPLWHNDYFELKALEKQQVQEGCSDPPPLFFLKAGENALVKDALPGLPWWCSG